MKLEKTILDDHQAQVVVEVDAAHVEAARKRAARKMAARGKIPGFRPGKAPYEVILRFYGDEAVYEQAVDLLVDEVYPQMLDEAEIKPAAAGSLEKVDGTDHPKFTFKVPLTPEVTLGNYRALRAPYQYVGPRADTVEEALEDLRHAYGTTETVEREAAVGDYVVVDIKADAKTLERTGYARVIRSTERPDDFPYPGFAAELIGLNVGETKALKHAYAQERAADELAGQTVNLEVTMQAVRSLTLPPLDDEFAKMVGKYESVADLRKALAKEIEARARAEYDDEYFANLLELIRQGASLKYAPQTLAHEAEHVVNDMRRRLAQQGLDLDTYYKMRNTDAAKFLEEEAKPAAKKRLERSLILDEISRQEKIEVDNSALDEEFSSTLLDLQTQGLNLNSIRGGRQGQQRVAEALAMQSANRLLTRRTLERLRAIATGESAPEADTAAGERTVEEAKPIKGKRVQTRKDVRKESASKSSGKTGGNRQQKSKNSTATAKK